MESLTPLEKIRHARVKQAEFITTLVAAQGLAEVFKDSKEKMKAFSESISNFTFDVDSDKNINDIDEAAINIISENALVLLCKNLEESFGISA